MDMQGQIQIRLLKDLLQTGIVYMTLPDFVDAYQSANRTYCECANDREASDRWLQCMIAVQAIACIRFSLSDWITAIGEGRAPANLTVTITQE